MTPVKETVNPLLVKLLDSSKSLSLSAKVVLGFSPVDLLLTLYQYLRKNEIPNHDCGFKFPSRVYRGQQIGRQEQTIPVPTCTEVHSWVCEYDGVRLSGIYPRKALMSPDTTTLSAKNSFSDQCLEKGRGLSSAYNAPRRNTDPTASFCLVLSCSPKMAFIGNKRTRKSIKVSHRPLENQKMLKLKQYRGSLRLLIQLYLMGRQFTKLAIVHPIQKHNTRPESATTSRRNARSIEKIRLYMSKMESFVDEVTVK